MKFLSKTIAVLLCVFTVLPVKVCALDLSAESAILIEADSGEIIYEKNANQRMSMASTTKIMTALVAIEHSDLSDTVIIAEEACGIEGSSIYLTRGETLTLEQLLYAVMLESANDAAAAVAYHIAGGVEAFADLMNETAKRIGLCDTHFTNPHGLDEVDHYTTASDLARLTAYALENKQFRTIVSTYKMEIPGNNDSVRVLVNHNKLLRLSDDVIGVKTGFTKHSGRCLVSAAERDGVRVIAVTLRAPDDWNDHLSMHSLGLSEYTSYSLAEPGEFTVQIPCIGGDSEYVTLQSSDALSITMKSGKVITHEVVAERMAFAPIRMGDALGEVKFYCDGDEIGSVLLYATSAVTSKNNKTSISQKILDLFR